MKAFSYKFSESVRQYGIKNNVRCEVLLDLECSQQEKHKVFLQKVLKTHEYPESGQQLDNSMFLLPLFVQLLIIHKKSINKMISMCKSAFWNVNLTSDRKGPRKHCFTMDVSNMAKKIAVDGCRERQTSRSIDECIMLLFLSNLS